MSRSAPLMVCVAFAALLAACGSGSSDGTTPTPPASPPAPTRGLVGVRAFSNPDRPAVGVDVVFGDASGAVLQHTQTDASGLASFTMDAGGMVTLLVRNPDNEDAPSLQTITDLRPGDVVQTYASSTSSASVPRLGSVQIDFPERRVPSGTVAIQIDLGCQSRYLYPAYGDRLQGYVVDVYQYCAQPAGALDISVTALNGDFVPLAFSTCKGIVLNPAGKTPAHFTTGWRTDFRKFGIEYTNVVAGMTRLLPSVTPVHEGTSRGPYQGANVEVAAGESGTRTIRYPDLAEALAFGVELLPAANAYNGPLIVYQRYFPDLPESARVDFATDVPPLVTNVALTDGTTVRPGATWSAPADLPNVDLGSFNIDWQVGRYNYAYWSVAFPPGAQPPLRVPALPEELAAFRPPPDPQRLRLSGVSLESDSTVSGYHEFLAAPLASTAAGSWAFSQALPKPSTAGGAFRAQLTPGVRTELAWGSGFSGGIGLKGRWLRRAAP